MFFPITNRELRATATKAGYEGLDKSICHFFVMVSKFAQREESVDNKKALAF